MTASSNSPPPNDPGQRSALVSTPYASLPARVPSSPPGAPNSTPPSGVPASSSRKSTPTWTDTTKARARACKKHNLARRPDGSCMGCERENREARRGGWVWLALALALGAGGAWFVTSQNHSPTGQALPSR